MKWINIFSWFCMAARVLAWALPSAVKRSRSVESQSQAIQATHSSTILNRKKTLLYASSNAEVAPGLSDEEFAVLSDLYEKAERNDESTLDQVVLEALPTMDPQLIMKLRGAVQDPRQEFQALSGALSSILDAQLAQAREQLSDFLNAGEVRKLDYLIGKAGREGKLDVAFFQVLNMNLQDAAKDAEIIPNPEIDEPTASRFQVLQHVYTRCQEEIEKTIPPGVSLLNKLLRTEAASIRSNQLSHYLCPQPNVIKTPDGQELELKGRERTLVPHNEFADAIANAVKQIRNVEQAGGANRELAANMVESCRQVAKEARIVIGEHFGRESDELRSFEDALQPVFRPQSVDSPYMKGA